jgi:hypothetical protein
VLAEALELLYSFSFHTEAVPVIKREVIQNIAGLCDIGELRPQLIRIFYKCSIGEGSDEAFRNEKLVNMLIYSTTIPCEERFVSLVILSKLALDRQISQTIARSPIFTVDNLREMFVHATMRQSEESGVLRKLIRNVADNQPDLIRGFDADVVAAAQRNSEKTEVLIDVLAINNRARMTSDRAKFFTGQTDFVALIIGILANEKSAPQLHLECVMLVAALVLYSCSCQALAKMGIVDKVVTVCRWHAEDLDIIAQCLFAFCRLICHAETRSALLEQKGTIEAVLRLTTSKNAVLNAIANAVVDAIMTFDQMAAETLRTPRFDAFNHEWLGAIAPVTRSSEG